MRRALLILLLTAPLAFICQNAVATQAKLISVVYDFDGLDIGQTDLPDGDFGNGLHYEAAANPAAASNVIGDRVVKLDLNWQSASGEFGKATMRFVELNASTDYLNFYIYNPPGSSGNAELIVAIAEDDNANDFFEGDKDDKWTKQLSIPPGSGWQLYSIPLRDFQDSNPGGNGIFDAALTNAAGMLFSVSFIFQKPSAATASDTYYLDMICFSDGPMPTGATALDLPAGSGGACALGALTGSQPDGTPQEVLSYLPEGKSLTFVNWFLYYANSGTTPNLYPGPEVQNLLDAGYKPIITWEMMFSSFARLDPAQPRLDALLNGQFDGYIDAFAAKIKSYSGTVIMRIFHEFEGDWYPWSLTENGKDPAKYKAAFRHVVDRFRSAGANNVQWMWCLNAEPKPYKAYNWVVSAYPGDDYVDIVATDIYNHPDLGAPAWKSFRYTMAESYYILTKYYGHKPLYICEVGCRERGNSPSQSKGDWICQMNRDLKAYFGQTKALIFFSMTKEHDWRINSSDQAKDAFISCIWKDDFYGRVAALPKVENPFTFTAFPNPFAGNLSLLADGVKEVLHVTLTDVSGRFILDEKYTSSYVSLPVAQLPPGVYIIEVKHAGESRKQKLVKVPAR